jgi:hypothetical protein
MAVFNNNQLLSTKQVSIILHWPEEERVSSGTFHFVPYWEELS